MRRQPSAALVVGLLLASVHPASAQDVVVQPVPSVPVAAGYTLPYQRGWSLKHICEWWTYRPLPVPAKYQCPRLQPTALPPLYLYFIGEFGPRSPELAHMTGGYAAGGVYSGPTLEAQNAFLSAPFVMPEVPAEAAIPGTLPHQALVVPTRGLVLISEAPNRRVLPSRPAARGTIVVVPAPDASAADMPVNALPRSRWRRADVPFEGTAVPLQGVPVSQSRLATPVEEIPGTQVPVRDRQDVSYHGTSAVDAMPVQLMVTPAVPANPVGN